MFLFRVPPVACNRLPFTSLQCTDRLEDTSDKITVDNIRLDDETMNRIRDDRGRIDRIEDRRKRIVSPSSDNGGDDLEYMLKPVRKINDNAIRNSFISAASSAFLMSIALFHKATRADALVLDGQYIDSVNK